MKVEMIARQQERNIMKMLLIVLLLLAAASVQADDNDQELARQLTRSGDIVPLEKVIARTVKEYGGNLLEAELEKEGGQYVYELQMLMSDGVVWEYIYDAKTAKLIRKHRER